jgi:hypothetical protein
LERRTKPAGGRSGVLGQDTVLRTLLWGFLRHSDGLCCPFVKAIQRENRAFPLGHLRGA